MVTVGVTIAVVVSPVLILVTDEVGTGDQPQVTASVPLGVADAVKAVEVPSQIVVIIGLTADTVGVGFIVRIIVSVPLQKFPE